MDLVVQDAEFQHGASVLAEWLDNDEDGCVDTPEVMLAGFLMLSSSDLLKIIMSVSILGFETVPVSPGCWDRPRAGAGEHCVPGHQGGHRQGCDHGGDGGGGVLLCHHGVPCG